MTLAAWHDVFSWIMYIGLASPVFAALVYAIGAARDGEWSLLLFWVFGVFTIGGLAGVVNTEPVNNATSVKAKP